MKRGLLSWLLHKKEKVSLNTNFSSERNFADAVTTCSSFLQGKTFKNEVNVRQEPITQRVMSSCVRIPAI